MMSKPMAPKAAQKNEQPKAFKVVKPGFPANTTHQQRPQEVHHSEEYDERIRFHRFGN